MSHNLIQDGPDKATEHPWLMGVGAHYHGEANADDPTQISLCALVFGSKTERNLPRHENLTTGDEGNVGLATEDRPQALESPREDVHRELSATLLLLDEE